MHTKRIARGARWLDKKYPGWYKRVNVNYLDPGSSTDCVIGQTVGNFDEIWNKRYFMTDWMMTRRVWFLFPNIWIGLLSMYRKGFDTVRETDWQWKEAWANEINKRKDQNIPMYVPIEWEAEAEVKV